MNSCISTQYFDPNADVLSAQATTDLVGLVLQVSIVQLSTRELEGPTPWKKSSLQLSRPARRLGVAGEKNPQGGRFRGKKNRLTMRFDATFMRGNVQTFKH